MRIVDQKVLEKLSEEAKSSKRLRKNKNYHYNDDDTLQRMLNSFEPNSYICPHKHQNPDKRELFIILSGKMLIIEFDENGKIVEHIVLDALKGAYSAEIPANTYHACYALKSGTVVWEIKDGPYNINNDKTFAPWAPKEEDLDCIEYMNSIFKQLEL